MFWSHLGNLRFELHSGCWSRTQPMGPQPGRCSKLRCASELYIRFEEFSSQQISSTLSAGSHLKLLGLVSRSRPQDDQQWMLFLFDPYDETRIIRTR